MLVAVAEGRVPELQAEGLEHCAVGNASKGENHSARRHRRQLGAQIIVTVAHLGPHRLVLRRQALDRIGDSAVQEPQRIAPVQRRRLVAESERVQRLVEQLARVVACERPPGTVGAVHARREPDDQQPRTPRTERRHRTRVVVRMLRFHLVKERSQARTAPTVQIEKWRSGHGAYVARSVIAPQGRFPSPNHKGDNARRRFPMKKKSRRRQLGKVLFLAAAFLIAIVLAAGLGAALVVFVFGDDPGRETMSDQKGSTSLTASGSKITLGWDASSSASVDGYTIHYGSSSGNYSETIFVGNQTSYTLTGLEAGRTYYIAITSRAAGGTSESAFSDEIVVNIPE